MNRRGMTLVEMMVATTATLILMAAVAQVFSVFGSALSDSRSMVELDARMRTVAARLRGDLSGATARPLPPLDPQAGEGYFEIIEGPQTDLSAAAGTTDLAADTDDVLLLTTRNSNIPFLGRSGTNGGFVESTVAEVAWFLRPTIAATTPTLAYTSNPATFTLFRRQLLVVGLAGFSPFSDKANTAPASSWSGFFDQYDISARVTATGTVTPNTLADLTRRESRFLHSSVITSFPFPFVNHQAQPAPDGLIFAAPSPRVGEDVVLTNVLSFDVRVFDPVAPVDVVGDAAVVPGDRGATGGTGSVASGAYVDLGNGSSPGPSGVAARFSGYGDSRAGTGANGLQGSLNSRRTYDTWSTHYEANGVDEDDGGSGPIDEGSDGLDNNDNGQVDETDEQETSPPYPVPLRGVEVRIRCYEPASRQVRQITVRHTFVPH